MAANKANIQDCFFPLSLFLLCNEDWNLYVTLTGNDIFQEALQLHLVDPEEQILVPQVTPADHLQQTAVAPEDGNLLLQLHPTHAKCCSSQQ